MFEEPLTRSPLFCCIREHFSKIAIIRQNCIIKALLFHSDAQNAAIRVTGAPEAHGGATDVRGYHTSRSKTHNLHGNYCETVRG